MDRQPHPAGGPYMCPCRIVGVRVHCIGAGQTAHAMQHLRAAHPSMWGMATGYLPSACIGWVHMPRAHGHWTLNALPDTTSCTRCRDVPRLTRNGATQRGLAVKFWWWYVCLLGICLFFVALHWSTGKLSRRQAGSSLCHGTGVLLPLLAAFCCQLIAVHVQWECEPDTCRDAVCSTRCFSSLLLFAFVMLQAKLNAKIDSKSGTVQMGLQSQSVHEQLIDKAKVLSVRTYVLANTVVGTR